MNKECEVIRDLLPLYVDEVCSGTSRELIEEHLQDCPECSAILEKIRKNEIENNLREEKDQVIEYQAKRFKRRSTTVGSVVSGLFMVPILICLIVNLSVGSSLDWFYMVLGGLSILFTLAVCCFYTHGNWFFLAASAVLFGFALIGLPFAVRAEPVRAFIGNYNRWILIGAVDLILFANMMNMITLYTKSFISTVFMALLCAAGAWLLFSTIKDKRGE